METSWRQEALRVIDERYKSIKEAQPELSSETILKLVSLHYYPFGERAMHPYKMWLKAMKEYRGLLARSMGQMELPGPRDFAPVEGPLFDANL